ncbi:MAG: ATP-binding cassette domain-containing protein [Clostridia bacterium]|nr:ATP-binding cassette domain-containing protein [Clostridia bacterium]
MIKINHLCFAYRKNKPVLNDITLELTGGFYALVGKNGSGKSTLMNLMTGSLKAPADSIAIDGVPVSEEAYANKVSYLPQIFDPYPNLKVEEVLFFVAGLKGIAKKQIPETIKETAEKTNITEYLTTRFGKCSEGTKRRVGIAAALLGNRELIILDEPTAGLDPAERARFYETVRRCFAGKTVLISTHILEDIEFLADWVLMLSGGDITYNGSYEEYCKVLNGRLYTACIPEEEKKGHKIIGENRMADGRVICRVVAETPLPAEWNPAAAEPTKEDVWNYFERVYHE